MTRKPTADQNTTAGQARRVGTAPRLRPLKTYRQSLTQLVADSIREAILSREFPPGTRVTEATLAGQLGVSKTPVREALLRLQFIGVVEPDGPRGGRIVAASPKAIVDAYEIREALEVQAARLASTHANDKNIADIQKASARSAEEAAAGHVDEFRNWDRRFHEAVARAADNPHLMEMIRDAQLLTWTLRRRDVPLADDSLECAKHHEVIAESIASRDGKAAAEAMSFHISHVKDIVVAAFPIERKNF